MSAQTYGVGLYAPAGYAIKPDAIERAVARLEAEGHRVIVDPTCTTRWQRFSATDDERLEAITRMNEHRDVDLAIAVRGGYGWSRLIGRLDWNALARHRKRWLGHSDFTAFQLAALARIQLITFGGPMAAYDFGSEHASDYTMEHCWGVLDHAEHRVHFTLEGPDSECEGTLWGGNLAMVAHLAGTPYMPVVDGGILFLEDIGEHPYRIERMLYQLHHAGILERQQALLLGTFNGYEAMPNDNGYDLSTMVAHVRERFGVPILTGFRFGHCPDKLTLPVGGRCALRVEDGTAELHLFDYAHASR